MRFSKRIEGFVFYREDLYWRKFLIVTIDSIYYVWRGSTSNNIRALWWTKMYGKEAV